MSKYDLIVIGAGGFGTSAAYYAAKRGKKVLVLEQFERGHRRGSSHGESSIIRKAYFEHPDSIPLLQQGYKLWVKLEEISQRELISPCGLMLAGRPDCNAIAGSRSASQIHGLDLENISEADLEDRFPGFNIPDGYDVVYEVDGGVLHVEDCVDVLTSLAEKRGAEFQWDEAVTHWESDGDHVKVWTKETTFEADALIITAGAWSSKLLGEIEGFPQLNVLRKLMFWFPVTSDAYDFSMGASGFLFDMPYGEFYGFPCLDGQVIKVCQHSDGDLVTAPSELDTELYAEDLEPVARFLQEVMPDVQATPESHSAYMYTMSPDQQFIVDQHPSYQNVAFGAGFSGHGFEFASILGKVLSDLAIDYETELPIDFLRMDRFA
ncbi:N-methyl-L-tryptophan oxidase [Thalassoglobus sp.]|uniref:N-methyl-L-tryptophan oxidase n=1 Tax=Thalassoglobus sp. TaxID=2795869 RepID=UPI003AA95430